MSTRTEPQSVTAAELFSMPMDGYRLELLKGRLSMMAPAGGRHGRVAFRLAQLLGNHVDDKNLGQVYAAETGFKIDSEPDTVLSADVSFVRQSRLNGIEDDTGYLPLAPDFVVEVLSPNDRFSRVEVKALTWLDAGTKRC